MSASARVYECESAHGVTSVHVCHERRTPAAQSKGTELTNLWGKPPTNPCVERVKEQGAPPCVEHLSRSRFWVHAVILSQ